MVGSLIWGHTSMVYRERQASQCYIARLSQKKKQGWREFLSIECSPSAPRVHSQHPRALPVRPGSIPSTHVVAHGYNSSSRGSYALFWPLWAPGIHVVQTYMGQNTHMLKRWVGKPVIPGCRWSITLGQEVQATW